VIAIAWLRLTGGGSGAEAPRCREAETVASCNLGAASGIPRIEDDPDRLADGARRLAPPARWASRPRLCRGHGGGRKRGGRAGQVTEVVVADPAALTRTVFAALERAGARGIVSEGWAHLGGAAPPPNVFMIGDCPHDWLFARCRAVCHHGGAGTTAAGLRAGLPTVVVPFFGDQFFWGQMVADAGAGPEPVAIGRLDSEALAGAFETCRGPEVRERAATLGARLRETDGAELVGRSLYRHLPVGAMGCSRDPEHLATMYCDTCARRLCADCGRAEHSGHEVRPRGHVDWGRRPARGLGGELADLIADGARALRAGWRRSTRGSGGGRPGSSPPGPALERWPDASASRA
jgi:hypothetical protein